MGMMVNTKSGEFQTLNLIDFFGFDAVGRMFFLPYWLRVNS